MSADILRHRLRLRYIDTMPRKIESLTQFIDGVASGDENATRRARTFVHQLAGSAGGYGFMDLGELAKAAELAAAADFVATLKTLLEALDAAYRRALAAANETVLVIEDDVDMLPLLELAAHGIGDEVIVAVSAAEAEKVLKSCRVGVILLDLMLPDRDGREVLESIRDRPSTAQTPVVVLSAHKSPAVKRDCIELGVDHYLEKPVDQELLAAALVAAAARGQHFDREARRDPLTEVKNRAGFRESVAEIRSLSDRASLDASLAVIDLDHFKRVNDEYGHGMGDVVLREVAQLLKRNLRLADCIGRWGGEEFLVALPNTPVRGAAIALRKMLEKVKAQVFVHGDQKLGELSFSAGVVPLPAKGALDDVVDEADKLLYLAKNAGRGRVFGPEDQSLPARMTTILVAEDDADAASLVRSVLRDEGYDVRLARDGRAALDIANKENIDAFVLDWSMPHMSGDEVLAALRDDPRYADTPAMMLTAFGDDENISKAFDLGADDYIQKPFRRRVLAARLRRLLGGTNDQKASAK